jgi:HSP20 family protein
MSREFDERFFTSMLGQFMSSSVEPSHRKKIPVDVVNEEKTTYIYAEIPGVNKEEITVDFYNNKLTISVDRKKPYDRTDISEIKYGKLERTLTLPLCVTRRDTVNVSYTNGILKIKINKLVEEENKFSVKLD